MNKIIKIFKHIFIPHERNDYKPHFFREFSVGIIAITAIILFSVNLGTKLYIDNKDMMGAVLPAVLVDLTNNTRLSNGAGVLTRSSVLDQAAQLKANDMATYDYFAHTSPQGVTPWSWFSKVGYSFVYAGENLAIDFSESEDVDRAWLNSPTHKANILNNKFTEIGIAIAEGYYNGHKTVYVVQMFGKPLFVASNYPSVKDIIKEEFKINPIEEPIKEIKIAEVSNVKGEAVTVEEEFKIITETEEYISVENTAIVEDENELIAEENKIERYSTWAEKFVFLAPLYTNIIYRVFIYILLIALILMTVIEIKRQHPKNIVYAILLLIIISCLVYINKSIFVVDFLS
ncbi:MAG: CAP domain-containing protein [Vampirovibrionia bacterium]